MTPRCCPRPSTPRHVRGGTKVKRPTDQLRRALDMAVAGGHEVQVGRAFSNLHSFLCSALSVGRGRGRVRRGSGVLGARRDFSTYEACLKGGHIRSARDAKGRWDETLLLGREIVARAQGAPVAGEPAQPAAGRRTRPGSARRPRGCRDARGGTGAGAAAGLQRLADATRCSGSLELAWLTGDEATAHRYATEVAALCRVTGPRLRR